MNVKLFLEIDTEEEEDAPLSEVELERVEKAVVKVRDGNFKVTEDPAERDKWLADGVGVMWYRKASREDIG